MLREKKLEMSWLKNELKQIFFILTYIKYHLSHPWSLATLLKASFASYNEYGKVLCKSSLASPALIKESISIK
jgi:hypothetical protein